MAKFLLLNRAVTIKVMTNVTQKYRFHLSINPSVFATTIINVAETVENPVAIIAASFAVYFPSYIHD